MKTHAKQKNQSSRKKSEPTRHSGSKDSAGKPLSEAMIDETVAESFPASDPPSWTTGRDIHNQPGETNDDELIRLPTEELNDKAAELNIAGHHSMTREQLILAIRTRLATNAI